MAYLELFGGLVYLLLAVPFAVAALVVLTALAACAERPGRVYGASFAGSGLGAVVALVSLAFFSPVMLFLLLYASRVFAESVEPIALASLPWPWTPSAKRNGTSTADAAPGLMIRPGCAGGWSRPVVSFSASCFSTECGGWIFSWLVRISRTSGSVSLGTPWEARSQPL